MTQEAQLEDASSGFGGEQSPKLPLLFLGLSLELVLQKQITSTSYWVFICATGVV